MFSVKHPTSLQIDAIDIIKSEGGGEVGVFSGYAAVFNNRDLDNDMILPGAFPKEINAKSVKMLRQHKQPDLIGVWKDIRPDDKGVFVKGAINLDVQLGRETYSLMKQGALDQMSVGMRCERADVETKEMDLGGGRKRTMRNIKKVAHLYEISLVTIAANPEARITDVKSFGDLMSLREFEQFLRDADLSRKERIEPAAEYKAFLGRINSEFALFLRKHGFEREAEALDVVERDADGKTAAEAEAAKAKSQAEAAAIEKAAADAEAVTKAIREAFGTAAAHLSTIIKG